MYLDEMISVFFFQGFNKKTSKKWLKIKIKEDGYKGFVKRRNFSKFSKPTHKVNILKSKIFKFPNKNSKINEISFGSKIKVVENKKNCYKPIPTLYENRIMLCNILFKSSGISLVLQVEKRN